MAVKVRKKGETLSKRSHGQCWGTANRNYARLRDVIGVHTDETH
jgi:hypothetical protein